MGFQGACYTTVLSVAHSMVQVLIVYLNIGQNTAIQLVPRNLIDPSLFNVGTLQRAPSRFFWEMVHRTPGIQDLITV